jgi:glycosyltransferase involved in cell wall biosynthesis
MRTRDRPLFLRRALDDVLAQDFADWRLIIVNDGGDPEVPRQVVDERRESLGGRVEVIDMPGGGGSMEAAANRGVQHGAEEFVVIHDDDDTWHPEFLSSTVAALDADSAAVAVAVETEIVFERLSGGTIRETGRRRFAPPGEMVTLFDLLLANRSVPIAVLVRRSTYEHIGYYDETLLAVGDWEFNLRLVRHGAVPYLSGRPLAYWHQRPRARGAASNSLFGDSDRHVRFDRLVRERALEEYVTAHGPGSLLYLTKYIDERLEYYSLVGTVRRVLRRLLRRRSRR